MVKSDKDRIKKTFFNLLDSTKKSDFLKRELHQTLINQAAIHSISMESDFVHPVFLSNQHNPEDLRYIERNFPKYFNLIIETTSLINAYTNLENLILKRQKLDFNWLTENHKMIFRRSRYNIAGKIRSDKSPETLNGSPLPHHSIIPEQMEQHFDWLHDRLAQHRKVTPSNLFEHIFISAEMHFRLLTSMPFEYANGIIARFVSDYILLSRKIFFPVVEYSSKERYINALKNTKVDNYRELTDYFIEMFGNNVFRIKGFIEISNVQQIDQDTNSESKITSTNFN